MPCINNTRSLGIVDKGHHDFRDVGGTSNIAGSWGRGGGGGGGSQGPLHILKVLFVSKFEENIEWGKKRREKRMLISPRVRFELGIVGETNTKFIYSR